MPDVRNTTGSDIVLLTGHVLPAGQVTPVTGETLAHPDNWPFVSGKLDNGSLVYEAEARTAREPATAPDGTPTRTTIAKMRKDDLKAALERHGLTQTGPATADELRIILAEHLHGDGSHG